MELGFVVDNRYVIKSLLGSGGMGDVYLVENIKLESLWAMKKISKDSRLKVDYRKELEILKKLNHNSLPRIFDFFEDADYLYLILDYFEGETLDERYANKKINIEKAIEITKQLCDVMIYLHEQKPNPIIYRDIKPSNIIIMSNGKVKLIDFGIAREFKIEKESDTIYIGSRGYAAPEQYGRGQTDIRTDIYSVGIILYQLITGVNPRSDNFEITNEIMDSKYIPKEFQNIINKSTATKPSNRYKKIRDLMYDINNAITKNDDKKLRVREIIVIPNDYKKVILILGSEGAGISTITKGLTEYFEHKRRRTSIVDLTQDNKLYRRIGLREDKIFPEKAELSKDGIQNLLTGKMAATIINKDTKLFLSDKNLTLSEEDILDIIDKLKPSNDIVIFISGLNSIKKLFKYVDGIYFIKDMSPYNCYKYNEYISENFKNESYYKKIKFVINKCFKSTIKPVDIKNTCCDNLYKENEMKLFSIPFEIENSKIALENEKYEGFTCRNYSKLFRKNIELIARDIYPVKKLK